MAGTRRAPKTFPVTTTPLPMMRPSGVPFITWSKRSLTPATSPKEMTPASMATPMAAPVSMASSPASLHRLLSSAIASMSPMPQLEPSRAIFSYCSEATVALPAGSGKTFEHWITQPGTQGCPLQPWPPLLAMSPATASPEIASTCSKCPALKLRVGKMPRASHRARTAGVPKL